jgi:hypothetical protein
VLARAAASVPAKPEPPEPQLPPQPEPSASATASVPQPIERYFHDLCERDPRRPGETRAAWARRLHGLMQKDHKAGRIEKPWKESTIYRELSGRK